MNLKFNLFIIGILVLAVVIGFLAVKGLDGGAELAREEIPEPTITHSVSTPKNVPEEPIEEVIPEPEPEPELNEHQDLIDDLQSLKDRAAILEPGDTGAHVGIIQQFLNVYNDTSGGVDNDFGPGTRSQVENFQANEGLTVDGGVGPGTLGSMLAWLEANG